LHFLTRERFPPAAGCWSHPRGFHFFATRYPFLVQGLSDSSHHRHPRTHEMPLQVAAVFLSYSARAFQSTSNQQPSQQSTNACHFDQQAKSTSFPQSTNTSCRVILQSTPSLISRHFSEPWPLNSHLRIFTSHRPQTLLARVPHFHWLAQVALACHPRSVQCSYLFLARSISSSLFS
jgi:hypothetical protein